MDEAEEMVDVVEEKHSSMALSVITVQKFVQIPESQGPYEV